MRRPRAATPSGMATAPAGGTVPRGMAATFRAACASAAARRGALAAQLGAMIVNDLGWVVFWLLFFERVGDMRGWDGDGVLLLLAMICSAAGVALGLLANTRHVGAMVADGQLDEVLRLPVPPLSHLLLRRVEPVILGDLLFGFGLFLAVGDPTPLRLVVFAGAVAAGSVILASFLVLVSSLSFFVGRGEAGELGFRAVIVFGTYPADVFAGVAKAVLYTAIPAALVSTVPSRLVESFDAGTAALVAAVAAGFAVAATTVFCLGLRRYTSGAVWMGG
jgi:viologen exporter family transport system permease protein